VSASPNRCRRVLARLLGSGEVGRSVLAELDREYAERAQDNARAARWWYRREAVAVACRARSIVKGDMIAARQRAGSAGPRGDSMLRGVLDDLRDATRSLASQPRFTVISAITLALGIGAVTAIFSVVNGILLKPLAYPEADRLVNVWSTAPTLGYDQFQLSADLYVFYREQNDAFEEMGIYQTRQGSLTDGETPETVEVSVASPSYFDTVGAVFSQGRPYTVEEDLPDGPHVAVVSHRFWTRQRGGDPAVLGGTIRLDGTVRQVVGIAPAWLDQPESPDVWIPTGFNPEAPPAGVFGWNVVGRLKPGVGPDEAALHLEPLVRRAMEEIIQSETYRAFLTNGNYRPLVHLMKEDLVGDLRRPLWILLGTVGMLLLIACANVANLFLVRAEGRQRDIAVRVALGSGRSGLVRKLLTEALVLSVAGTALGVVVSAVALPSLLRVAPPSIPRLDQVGLDLMVVLFAAGVAMLSAFVFGLVPALRYTRPDVVGVLRHGGRGGTGDPARRRGRNLLVMAQTAMALVLLVGSGLLVRSFGQMMAVDLGFEPGDVASFRVSLNPNEYPETADVVRFENDLLQRLAEVPGVEATGAASVLPIASGAPGTAHEFDGQPIEPGQVPPLVHYVLVSTGYFDTMGMELRAGRDFDSRDAGDDVRSVVVNTALAEQYWPNADPVGKRLRVSSSSSPDPQPWYTVVGVVETVRQDGVREPVRPLIYYHLNATTIPQAASPRSMALVVRGPGATSQPDALRRAVWSLDAGLPVPNITSMDDVVEESLVQFSFTMLTLGIAATMALALGAIGLYGVLSYAVTLRTREIGVRLALGAAPSVVMRMVVTNGAAIAGVGLLVGLAGAAALTRFLGGILFETEPLDPLTFLAMSAALFVVCLVASYLPARKAALVSPLESMRAD